MNNHEVWRSIHQLNGRYEVSNLGNIRRTDNRRPIKTQRHRQGYRLVQLWIGGKRWQATVHSAVAEAFIGPRPCGQVICHANDDPADNRLANLRFATQAENMADASRNGRLPFGEKNRQAKLTDDKVREIRARRAAGETCTALGKELGVRSQTISDICRRQSWKHI